MKPDLNAEKLRNDNKTLLEEIKLLKLQNESFSLKEKNLRSLIDVTAESVLLLDKNGIVLEVNNTGAMRFFSTADELIGKPIYHYFPDEIKESRKLKFMELLETGNPVQYSDKRGDIELSISMVPIFDEEKNVISVAVFGRDITELKETYSALNVSLTKYRDMIEQMTDGFFITDMSGNITYGNQALTEMLGQEESRNLTGKSILDFIKPDFKKYIFEMYQKDLQAKDFSRVLIIPAVKKDGSDLFLEIRPSHVIDNGKAVGFSGVMRDVTERISNEQKIRFVYTAMEESPLGVMITDANAHIIYTNKEFTRSSGFINQDFIGKCLSDFLGIGKVELFDSLKSVEHGEKWRGEIQSAKKNGALYWISFSVSAVKNENQIITHYILNFEDISIKKNLEQKIEETLAELQRSNEDLGQFAYIASHDLKEPLRSISGYLQLLEKQYSEKLDEKASDFIKRGVLAAERLRSLIDDLLDYSRLSTRLKENSVCDFNEIVRKAEINLRMRIHESGAIINTAGLPEKILADEAQMIRVFQNLIVNAIKFHSFEKPEIFIHAEKKEKFWQFSINDNGIGIHPEFHEKIFKVFQRLHGKDKYEGSGIGLSIVKKIIERHGGSIWVDSQEGMGSTFYFTLKSIMGSDD